MYTRQQSMIDLNKQMEEMRLLYEKQKYERMQQMASREYSWTNIFSQGSWNSPILTQEFHSSPSNTITVYPRPPQPPDPPDFNQFEQRLSKLEFPVFDGTLLDCWIAKVDRFFELKQYGNEEKLDLISLSLEGAALKWFRKHRREFTDWAYVKRKLMARFGLVKGCSPPEVLPKDKEEAHQETVKNPETFIETMTKVEPETMKNDPCMEPLKHASALQVPDSVNNVLLLGKMDSLVKEVGEVPQQSRSGNGEMVAHQLFDQMPNEYQKDLTVIESSNKEVLSFSHKDDRVWEPGGVPNKTELWNWPKGESKPHKKKSHQIETFEVFSHLEPSRRCHKESLDCVDKRMCNELAWDEDGDSIITISAKFRERYEEQQFESVSLKQIHDSVENYFGSFEYALTRSPLLHTPTDQYRAPFNPYQNCNDTGHYKREFGNYTGREIGFDRASEEVEGDELQDKQPEDEAFGVNVETSVVNEDKQTLVILPLAIPVISERVVKREKDYDGALLAPLDDTAAFSNLDAQQLRKKQMDLLLMLSRMIVVPFSTLTLMTCKVLELIKDKASKKRKLCKNWWFKYKLNTWLSEAFHFWKYKNQINQGQTCLNDLCNELVCDKEKKRESSEFNLKHKWRSRLEFCVEDVILFTRSVKLLFFTKNHKPLHPETGFCTHYNGLEQLSTEFQGSQGLNFFTYLIFKWNQALNYGCEAGHTSSGFFFVGDVHGDETLSKRLLVLNEMSLLDNENEVDLIFKGYWFHNEPMIGTGFSLMKNIESLKEHEQLEDAAKGIMSYESNIGHVEKSLIEFSVYGVFHLQRPPELGLTKQYGQELYQVVCLSSLRTRMLSRREYCDRRSLNKSLYFINLYFGLCGTIKNGTIVGFMLVCTNQVLFAICKAFAIFTRS